MPVAGVACGDWCRHLTRWDFPLEFREIRLGTIAFNRQAAETDDVDLVTVASLHSVVEAVDSLVGQD